MPFLSILFDESDADRAVRDREAPGYLSDLNLDQVIATVCVGREEYDLEPYFHVPLSDPHLVVFRQEVLRDLESTRIAACLSGFAERMASMREHVVQSDKLYYSHQKQAWFLQAAAIYCEATRGLLDDLRDAEPRSRGLNKFIDYLDQYLKSAAFASLVDEIDRVKRGLGSVAYSVRIVGSLVTVDNSRGEPDYSREVLDVFDRFKQEDAKDYRAVFPAWPEMNHVEAHILDFVARLHPEAFNALVEFCDRHMNYVDDMVSRFDREIQFYRAIRDHVDTLRESGLEFCYPTVTMEATDIHAQHAFDLALASKLASEQTPMVCNDFSLNDPERIIVVTGPNQGGKTTFARMFGQLHYLAALGSLVPGRQARLLLFDQIHTHFEKEEDLSDLTGKLEDDLLRLRRILELATSRSIVILNESFSSTTLADAIFLGRKIMHRVVEAGIVCVYVTFIDELSVFSETTVSMVATVVPEDVASRTYRVVRRPADGLAYASALAEKYGLMYQRLTERITG